MAGAQEFLRCVLIQMVPAVITELTRKTDPRPPQLARRLNNGDRKPSVRSRKAVYVPIASTRCSLSRRRRQDRTQHRCESRRLAFIVETDDRKYRPENPFLSDAHIIRDVGEDARLHKLPAGCIECRLPLQRLYIAQLFDTAAAQRSGQHWW